VRYRVLVLPGGVMIIRTPADLGAAIRAGRRAAGLGQADLAARVGVQRQWIIKIESGKSTAEVGLVLRTLNALGLTIEIGEAFDKSVSDRPPSGLSYDIDAALERTRPKFATFARPSSPKKRK
jgi:HTH-type transcriptional regulator/antitoxin HipB